MTFNCKEITENNLVIESSKNEVYELPLRIYEKYNFKKGENIEGQLKFDKRKWKNYFEPAHPKYKIGNDYEFTVVDFVEKEKKFIIVEDCFKNQIWVLALKWQDKEQLKRQIKCKIIDIKYGKPILRNIEYSHPIYEVGKEYKFAFIGMEKKKLRNGQPFDVIKLKGEDNCIHETPPLPSQYGHKFKPKSLTCKVVEITSYLKLEQTSYVDVYFSPVEEIVSTKHQVLKAYFYDLRQNDEYSMLFKQYDSNSSLWTITYCNKVLPQLIINYANNFNFKEASLLISILLEVEEWILKSGLLDSFKKEDTKTQIKVSSERFIEKFGIMKASFDFIINNDIAIKDFRSLREKVLVLSYYLRFNKDQLIDKKKLFDCFKELIVTLKDDDRAKFETKYLIDQIEYQKSKIKNDAIEKDFTIGNNSHLPFNSHDDLNLYLKYSFAQSLLSKKDTKRNIYLGEFYKYLSFHFVADIDKKNSLKQAYFLINNQENCPDIDVELINEIDNIEYLSNSISSSLLEKISQVDKDEWVNTLNHLRNNETITVKLKSRTVFGYVGFFNNIFCILPNSHINSNILKYYVDSICDIHINATILDSYYNFSTIIVKELPIKHKEHKIENILSKDVKVGDVITGRVKNTTSYGVFLSTYAGEGLLHINNITDLFIDAPLKSIFATGEEIKVKILNINEDGKFDFGLRQLIGTDYEENLFEIEFKIFAPDIGDGVNKKESIHSFNTELNKQLYIQGHLFEYFSNLQYDFEGKIKYLKLSKIYYAAIQSSRSYFLNTYISYFDILNSVECALDKKCSEQLESIIDKSKSLHSQLQKNTISLEKFPSIYRLVFFLDILRQFNSVERGAIENLAHYILDEKYSNYPILSKVAKVVLSNNLIISEQLDIDFMFKNLRILFQYLKEGTFDLSENEHEKRERELKEKISSIRSKVFNEESEKVEFKSSLISPVLDSKSQKRLHILEQQKSPKVKNEIDQLTGKPAKNRITHTAMKTLVAFANSKGGTLFIGINDEGEFIGLQNDYSEIGQESRDELGKKLDEYIKNYIGNSFFGLVSINFESIDKKDILIIDVKNSENEVFLIKDDNGKETSDFYIRRHSSSVKLSGKELIEYYKWRYNKPSA